MSMQLSATPAAKTLAVTEELAAEETGEGPASLITEAHSPAIAALSGSVHSAALLLTQAQCNHVEWSLQGPC